MSGADTGVLSLFFMHVLIKVTFPRVVPVRCVWSEVVGEALCLKSCGRREVQWRTEAGRWSCRCRTAEVRDSVQLYGESRCSVWCARSGQPGSDGITLCSTSLWVTRLPLSGRRSALSQPALCSFQCLQRLRPRWTPQHHDGRYAYCSNGAPWLLQARFPPSVGMGVRDFCVGMAKRVPG